MDRDAAACRCDHTGAAHSVSWLPVPTCQVVWCTCTRYRPVDATLRARWDAWRGWRRLARRWRRDHTSQHRLGR